MTENLEWPPGPAQPILTAGQVHVWRSPLDLDGSVLDGLRMSLSDEELERAARFRFDEHRNRFIAARGVLRDILSKYLHQQARAIEFSYNAFGKPALKLQGQGIQFNLSHSGALALFALSANMQLGVDVEQMRPGPADLAIAERFFSQSEVAALRALPTDIQSEAFFNCWTRKEAYVKALGGGLQIPLDSFDVSIAPGEPAVLHSVQEEGQKDKWSLQALHPAPGYAAALVAEGHDWEIQCLRWVPGG
jgi:4'-phosphopantetheinyl transferase